MIVGTRNILTPKLLEACKSVEDLQAFSESLIPAYAKHIPYILDNQKYIVSLEVRDMGIPYKRKKELCEGLLEGVTISGEISTIIDIEDMMSNININRFYKSIFRGELDEG